jgi:hypothetical protein
MRSFVLIAVFAFGCVAIAQEAPAAANVDFQQLVMREFGAAFRLDPKFPPMFADLDGDGQEDVILVATGKNPLLNAFELHYQVLDPYDAYFGYGNPKITAQFAITNVGPPLHLLVIHNWRAPRAKFVIINLPFEKLTLGRVPMKKKKSIAAIRAEETGGLTADVFWDGKKYRWEPDYLSGDQ